MSGRADPQRLLPLVRRSEVLVGFGHSSVQAKSRPEVCKDRRFEPTRGPTLAAHALQSRFGMMQRRLGVVVSNCQLGQVMVRLDAEHCIDARPDEHRLDRTARLCIASGPAYRQRTVDHDAIENVRVAPSTDEPQRTIAQANRLRRVAKRLHRRGDHRQHQRVHFGIGLELGPNQRLGALK